MMLVTSLPPRRIPLSGTDALLTRPYPLPVGRDLSRPLLCAALYLSQTAARMDADTCRSGAPWMEAHHAQQPATVSQQARQG
jgi:hypothetical protein